MLAPALATGAKFQVIVLVADGLVLVHPALPVAVRVAVNDPEVVVGV
jgi:hypothetical protein